MKRGLIGVQMSTIKDKVKELGVYPTLEALAEMGYKSVEVSQIDMSAENVKEIRRAIDELGFKVAALSASLEPREPGAPGEYLTTGFDKLVEDCKALDVDMLRIGMLPMSSMGSREKALDFVRRCDEYAERLREQDIDLYYHNHHVEFVKYGGEYLLDIIRDSTRYMGFELDIHWIQRGGANPLDVIRKYKDRIRLLHLKDYRITEVRMPEKPDQNSFRNSFYNIIQFAELGEGSLPIKECIDLALECGSEHFLVEQDDCYGRDPFESLRISRDHLYELGYKDWFTLPN